MPNFNCIYTLSKKVPVEARAEAEGITIRLLPDASELRLDGVTAASPGDAFESNREIAERFLDAVARDFGGDLEIVPSGFAVEHLDEQGKRVGGRVGVETVLSYSVWRDDLHAVHVAPAGVVRDQHESAARRLIPLPTSDAPRYYRKAITSRDPFDKFRNYFYVVEYVGSRLKARIKPVGKQYPKERGLVRFAVEQAYPGDADRLRSVARMIPGIDAPGIDVFQVVADCIYRANRNELQHAKFDQNRKVPFRRLHEDAVRETLPLMETLAQRLLSVEMAVFGP